MIQKYFSFLRSQLSTHKGFTLIEIIIVMGVILVLLTVSTMNLSNVQRDSQLQAAVNTFIADMREQQIKAMAGDTENTASGSDYGLRLETTQYTTYRGTYGTGNFLIELPETIQMTNNIVTNDLIFEQGSGDILSPITPYTTVTFTDTTDGSSTTLDINRYGVVENTNRL